MFFFYTNEGNPLGEIWDTACHVKLQFFYFIFIFWLLLVYSYSVILTKGRGLHMPLNVYCIERKRNVQIRPAKSGKTNRHLNLINRAKYRTSNVPTTLNAIPCGKQSLFTPHSCKLSTKNLGYFFVFIPVFPHL